MRRPVSALAMLAFAAISWGCGGDAKEEAPAVPTGEVIAQAPGNAVGADVPRPVVTAVGGVLGPDRHPPKTTPKPDVAPEPEETAEPEVPVVPPGATVPPMKGTHL